MKPHGHAMSGVWRWFLRAFVEYAPESIAEAATPSPGNRDSGGVGRQAIDASARNALLEIHFGDLEARRSGTRRPAATLSVLNR
jgi:hypothetical protein